jgi:hypothetical protein
LGDFPIKKKRAIRLTMQVGFDQWLRSKVDISLSRRTPNNLEGHEDGYRNIKGVEDAQNINRLSEAGSKVVVAYAWDPR